MDKLRESDDPAHSPRSSTLCGIGKSLDILDQKRENHTFQKVAVRIE